MTIQVSHGGDTIIVTGSPNQALAAIRDTLQLNPNPLPPIEVDLWEDGVISESRGFAAVESELRDIEAYINSLFKAQNV